MSRRRQIERSHRRAFAAAMFLSIGIHGAILAFTSLEVPVFPSDDDSSATAANRYMRQRPIQVVEIQASSAQTQNAIPATGEPTAGAPTDLATVAFKPRLKASASPAMTLQSVEVLPSQTFSVEDVLASTDAYGTTSVVLSEDISFQAASQAARRFDRKRKKGRDRGGRARGPILVVSGTGDCDAPTAAILNLFPGRNR